MVYTKRKKFVKRRRPVMKRKVNLYKTNKIYAFKRTCVLPPWRYNSTTLAWEQSTTNYISNSTTATPLSHNGIFKFRLSDVSDSSDFTNLYESFRITGVKLLFMPTQGTEAGGSATTDAVMEPIGFTIDRGANDQVNYNPDFANILSDQDAKLRTSFKPFSVYISNPMMHSPADGSTQVLQTRGYLDTENGVAINVDHHGLRYAFQAQNVLAKSVWYRVYATYYIKCKGPQ